MEMESQVFLELVGKTEEHLGSVDCLPDAPIGHDSVGKRLLITIVNLCSRSVFNVRDAPVPLQEVLFS